MSDEAKVEVELGQPAYIDGVIRQAGEKVMAAKHMAEALAYKPKTQQTSKPAGGKDGKEGE